MTRLDWEKANRQEARRSKRASPKGKPNAGRATKAQLAYIAALSRQLGIPKPNGIVTRSGAQATIRRLLKRRNA